MMKSQTIGYAAVAASILSLGAAQYTSMRALTSEVVHLRHDVSTMKEDMATLKREVEVVKKFTIEKTAARLHISAKETECLMKNVFHETGVEPLEGKIAVAQVTFKRLESARWGDDVCKVVHAKAQFSWTLQKKKVSEKPKGKLWDESVAAVEKFKAGYRVPELKNAMFYHTDYIKTPKWADRSKEIGQVGRHIFYTGAL